MKQFCKRCYPYPCTCMEIDSQLDQPENKKIFVVLHNHTIWKSLFFKSEKQAAMVVKRFHTKLEFSQQGNILVEKKRGKRFTIYEVSEYLKMDDVKFVHEF